MININDYEIFSKNLTTIKETSLDDDGNGKKKYMTDSEKKVIHFDKVKEDYAQGNNIKEGLKSNDALLINDKDIVFIEFKNGNTDNIKKNEIFGKIFDSLLIFMDITDKNIRFTKKNMEYILVYNEEKAPDKNAQEPKTRMRESKSFADIAKMLSKKAKKPLVRFGISKFKNYCFKDVHTFTKSEFEDYLSKI